METLITQADGALGWSFFFCLACCLAYRLWKRPLLRFANTLIFQKIRRRSNGTGTSLALWFAALCCAVMLYGISRMPSAISYACPNSCLGIVKVEGPNAWETVNLVTGKHREWRLCAIPPVQRGSIYPGYVIEIRVTERVGCQQLDEPSADPPYHIVRGKDRNQAAYGPVTYATYDDGPDRPVLANNCRNTPDDKDVICEGGDARFGTELSQR